MQRYNFFIENNQTRTHLLYKREEKQEGRNEVSKISVIVCNDNCRQMIEETKQLQQWIKDRL